MNSILNSLKGLWSYARYFLPLALAIGGAYLMITSASVAGMAMAIVFGTLSLVEWVSGDDLKTHHYKHPNIFVYMIQAYFPVTIVALVAYLWLLAHGNDGGDMWGIASAVQAVTGFDMIAAHANDSTSTYVLATLIFSLISSIGAVSIGHELSHRTWEPFSVFAARGCSWVSLFTYYAVEHPYGHHLSVGTPVDSSTALRGESIYTFYRRTALQDYQTAWEIEKDRLTKLGTPLWHPRNRLLQGWAAEIALLVLVTVVSGFFGLFWFMLAAFNTHFGYKLGVYGQHYGIVRVPNSEIKIHHSWDCYNRVTNWFVDGIGRHSQHHLAPTREFWNLEALDTPRYPAGYLACMGMAIIPPLWHRMWSPKLIEWDAKWASPEERKLAMEANLRSGRPELMALAAREQVANAATRTA